MAGDGWRVKGGEGIVGAAKIGLIQANNAGDATNPFLLPPPAAGRAGGGGRSTGHLAIASRSAIFQIAANEIRPRLWLGVKRGNAHDFNLIAMMNWSFSILFKDVFRPCREHCNDALWVS